MMMRGAHAVLYRLTAYTVFDGTALMVVCLAAVYDDDNISESGSAGQLNVRSD
jgi:hypothetical protein